MNERKGKHFSLQQIRGMSSEVWDEASCQNHVLQVENQFFNPAANKCKINPADVLFFLHVILL